MTLRACVLSVILGSMIFAACTERDESIAPIAVSQIYPVNSAIKEQSLDDPGIQYTSWEIATAELSLEGDQFDLTAGAACSLFNSWRSLPFGSGKCITGVVTVTNVIPSDASLVWSATMEVRRATPVDLPMGGDVDADGVANEVDNCPLIANPMQEDDDPQDGLGDACDVVDPITLIAAADNDGDGVIDRFDNCLGVPNPVQEDTPLAGDPFPDGIGDACGAQIASVAVGGNPQIDLALGPAMAQQDEGTVTLFVVDFDHESTLTCNWVMGTCTLDPAQVTFCTTRDGVTATNGCP